jgi:hypothetical protein
MYSHKPSEEYLDDEDEEEELLDLEKYEDTDLMSNEEFFKNNPLFE